jgi:hypothetical protein
MVVRLHGRRGGRSGSKADRYEEGRGVTHSLFGSIDRRGSVVQDKNATGIQKGLVRLHRRNENNSTTRVRVFELIGGSNDVFGLRHRVRMHRRDEEG